MHCYKFIIKGKVQGVFYRKSIYEVAKKAGFRGYVKNLDDGSVEAVALLNEENLKEFINILKKGSPYSITENIDYIKCNKTEFLDFEIRY